MEALVKIEDNCDHYCLSAVGGKKNQHVTSPERMLVMVWLCGC